jgi:N4-gp56 family major capsid protein
MGALTGTGQIPPPVQTYYDRALLTRAQPAEVHGRMAQRREMKAKSGDIIKFRRYNALALATTPLTEGIPPEGKSLTKTDIQTQVRQHGDYVTLTDWVQLVVQDQVLNEANKILGEQMGQTKDVLLRECFASGTNIYYGGGVTSRAQLVGVAQKVDAPLFDRMIRGLQNNIAKYFTEMITASVKVSTFGIRPSYWAVISPDVLFSLEKIDGYKSVEEYASAGPVLEYECGSYKNVRFLCTTFAKSFPGGGGTGVGDVKITGGNADVHTVLMFGTNAVGYVPLTEGAASNIIQPLGSGGAADPLKQRATSGWKMAESEIILNDAWLARAEVTVGLVAP